MWRLGFRDFLGFGGIQFFGGPGGGAAVGQAGGVGQGAAASQAGMYRCGERFGGGQARWSCGGDVVWLAEVTTIFFGGGRGV